jgi:nicotinate dehydrogenase subunit A
VPTRFSVNGVVRDVAVADDTPLVYVLRNDLGLKGTRFGCGTGHCGACTVLLDGHAITSCDTPLWSVAGKSVTTVEGLSRDGRPHLLQKAFIAEQAAQCGFCVSGILMQAAGLLERNAAPSDAELRQALDRNLCRCCAHPRMLRAIRRAAKEVRHG